jgi:beta-N-acetylhexosaminidase
MTAHVLVPALDADHPASLSSRVVTDLLKTAMKYDGMVLSDDLGMKAISTTAPLPDASVAAIHAGCDAVLFCNSTIDEQVAALEAVIRAAESGRLSSTRIDDAFARQRRVKARFLAQSSRPARTLDVVGCAEHWAVAEEMAVFR